MNVDLFRDKKICEPLFMEYTYKTMLQPEQLFEVRLLVPGGKNLFTGYFRDLETMLKELQTVYKIEKYQVHLVPHIINSECADRVQYNKFLSGSDAPITTGEKDILVRKWLYFDLDPIRTKGTGTDEKQHNDALETAEYIESVLHNDLGFPNGLVCDSGNGAHILYSCNINNTQSNNETITKLFKVIRASFDAVCKLRKLDFDMAPAKISQPFKFYGGYSKKGGDTKEKPYRLSKIITQERPQELKLETMQAIINKALEINPDFFGENRASDNKGKISASNSDDWLRQWFKTYYTGDYEETQNGNKTMFVMSFCPFCDRSDRPTAAYFDESKNCYCFNCFHKNTCGDKHFKDFRLIYEPDAYKNEQTDNGKRIDGAWNVNAQLDKGNKDNEIKTDETEGLQLILSNKGYIIDCIENAVRILTHDGDVGGKFRLNLFDRNIWIKCNAGECLPWRKSESNYRKYDNDDEAYLYRYLERNYNIKKAEKIDKGLRIAAREYAFNPIEELLNGTQWDGQPRIKTLLHDYLGAEANEYTAQVMQLVMLGAINRALKPGCKFDYVLIFVGSQGKYKSSFARLLAMDDNYFCDSLDKLGDKSAAEQLQGKWLVELPELKALKRTRERETIKSFITQTCDTYRPAYGKVAEDYPRTCVFIGTTNDDDFLTDPTGNRRFLPVQIDVTTPTRKLFDKETRAYIQQAWAEAMEIYRKGEYSLLIPDSLLETVEKVREQYIEEDPDRAIIEEWLKDKTQVCTNQLFWDALGNKQDFSKFDRREAARLNDIMKTFKDWKRGKGKKSFKPYGQCRYYQKVRLTYDNQAEKVGQVETATDGFLTMSDDDEQPF